jgi:hypothetical protein
VNICGHLLAGAPHSDVAPRGVTAGFRQATRYIVRNHVVSADKGAWCAAWSDGTLGAVRRRNARADVCCLPDAERLALPGVEAIDIDLREPTARLTLNAVNTTFASAIADDSAERADVVLGAEDLKTRALPAIEA